MNTKLQARESHPASLRHRLFRVSGKNLLLGRFSSLNGDGWVLAGLSLPRPAPPHLVTPPTCPAPPLLTHSSASSPPPPPPRPAVTHQDCHSFRGCQSVKLLRFFSFIHFFINFHLVFFFILRLQYVSCFSFCFHS